MFFISSLFLGAQDRPSDVKLSKHDRIWLAADDDTTKALALLFIKKRNDLDKTLIKSSVVGITSLAAFAFGALMLENNSHSPGIADGHAFGVIFVFGGATGVLCSGVTLILTALLKRAYTLKKYESLLAAYRAGMSLPRFYKKRIQRYL